MLIIYVNIIFSSGLSLVLKKEMNAFVQKWSLDFLLCFAPGEVGDKMSHIGVLDDFSGSEVILFQTDHT